MDPDTFRIRSVNCWQVSSRNKFVLGFSVNMRFGGGWGRGVVYLASPGRPTDFGLQLGKACCPCSKGRGAMFYFFYFFTFIRFPLSLLSLSFISSAVSSISLLPFSGRRHKMTHKGSPVVKPQHNQSTCGLGGTFNNFLWKVFFSGWRYRPARQRESSFCLCICPLTYIKTKLYFDISIKICSVCTLYIHLSCKQTIFFAQIHKMS